MEPELKSVVWQRSGTDLLVVYDLRERLVISDPDGTVERLLRLLEEGGRTHPGGKRWQKRLRDSPRSSAPARRLRGVRVRLDDRPYWTMRPASSTIQVSSGWMMSLCAPLGGPPARTMSLESMFRGWWSASG